MCIRDRSYTFYGPGLSQGHSDAVRQVDGVKYGAQYTLPNDHLVKEIEDGKEVNYTKEAAHIRDVYIVSDNTRTDEDIKEEIINMPDYFKGYETNVYFISEDEFKESHQNLNHGGYVLRRGFTNNNQATYKLSLIHISEPTRRHHVSRMPSSA